MSITKLCLLPSCTKKRQQTSLDRDDKKVALPNTVASSFQLLARSKRRIVNETICSHHVQYSSRYLVKSYVPRSGTVQYQYQ